MTPAGATYHTELTFGWAYRIFISFGAETEFDTVVVINPFSNISCQIIESFFIGWEATHRSRNNMAVVIGNNNATNNLGCTDIGKISIFISRGEASAPPMFLLTTSCCPSSPCPLGFCGQSIAIGIHICTRNFTLLFSIDRFKLFLIAQPVTVKSSLRPTNIYHRLGGAIQGVAIYMAGTVLPLKLLKLAIGDFFCGQIKGPGKLNVPQYLISASTRFTARGTHGKCAFWFKQF